MDIQTRVAILERAGRRWRAAFVLLVVGIVVAAQCAKADDTADANQKLQQHQVESLALKVEQLTKIVATEEEQIKALQQKCQEGQAAITRLRQDEDSAIAKLSMDLSVAQAKSQVTQDSSNAENSKRDTPDSNRPPLPTTHASDDRDTFGKQAPTTQPTGENPASYTATGIPEYVGPRGGVYHYSKSGKKVYDKH